MVEREEKEKVVDSRDSFSHPDGFLRGLKSYQRERLDEIMDRRNESLRKKDSTNVLPQPSTPNEPKPSKS